MIRVLFFLGLERIHLFGHNYGNAEKDISNYSKYMIYDRPFTPFIITKIIRERKIEKSTGRIDENTHNYPEGVRTINEYRLRLTDLFEEIEHAENDQQNILNSDNR